MHALHGPHGDVERCRDVHGHGRADGDRVGEVHVRRGGDVDGGEIDGARDGDRVLQVDCRRDVDRAGGNAHLSGRRDRVGGAGGAAVCH